MNGSGELKSSDDSGSLVYIYLVCLVAAIGGFLFGYDTAVISGAIGFLQKFYNLDPQWWTGWAAACTLLGCALGVAVAGIFSDWLGRKRVLIVAAIFYLVSAIGTAIPRNLAEFIIYRIVGGIGVGAASITSPMYIAEISPARIRGRMVSVNQFAIIAGMLVVYFVNYFIAGLNTEAWSINFGWRWMFGSEALPAFLFLVFLFFVPESPRYLAKQGRLEHALAVLRRFVGNRYAQDELASIQDAIQHENGSISQLFQPGMKIALLIGIVLAVLQQVTGINVFLYYAPEIFKSAGTGTSVALLQTIVVGAVNLGFTIIAIWTVDKLGRKPLMIIGSAGMGISLLSMGLAAFYQSTAGWLLIFILGYIACFAFAVGPVTWVILSEIFPTRIRGRAMAVAAFCLWLANYVVTQTFTVMDKDPYLVEKFHHAFPFWIYGILCAVEVIFVWLLVPETKGKTLEQIEQHWLQLI